MAQSQSAGIILMGPPLADTSPNGFKISAFTIDREPNQATCPDGKQAVKWRERTDRDGSKAVNIQFAAAECAVCPTRAQCTTSQSGRSVHLSEHYEILEARRAEAQTAEFREEMRARPAIEATLSELGGEGGGGGGAPGRGRGGGPQAAGLTPLPVRVLPSVDDR